MNAAQAKKIQLFDLLACLGNNPATTHSTGDVWYLSPFRIEKTSSFKINIKDNVWYDHGEGVGGNILDFVMKLKRTDFRGALKFLESTRLTTGNGSITLTSQAPSLFDRRKQMQSKILEIKPVFSFVLKNYLKHDRGLNLEVAYKYLKEIRYKVKDKEYFALGFPNRAGGWELRSSIFKGGIGEKDISIISNAQNRVHVFEGFMDFLSALTIKCNDRIGDNIILNSVALKKRAIEYIKNKNYSEIYTYFDNDPAGEKTQQEFKAEFPAGVVPCNYIYTGFNDLNDFLVKEKVPLCQTKK
jgi:DNA primase